MYFAIRDDDTSYFTSPDQIRNAYKGLENIPITLSVVPKATYKHGNSYPYGEGSFDVDYGLIGDNQELISFVRTMIKKDKFEVAMHGIKHEYIKEKNYWIPEMKAFKLNDSLEELKKQKEYLEYVFDQKITVFVAPSNAMSVDAHKAIDCLEMNTMGFLSKKMDHPFSIKYLKYWSERNINKLLRIEKPIRMKYRHHSELPVWPLESTDAMWKNYHSCKINGEIPFIIYTHYWHLNNCEQDKNNLKMIIEMMIKDGAKPKFVSHCF